MPELLTAEELIAEIFGSTQRLSRDKLYRLAKKKAVPCIWLDGRAYFPKSVWKEWIAKTADMIPGGQVTKPYGRLRAIKE